MQRLLVWLLLKLLHPRWQKKRSILKETRSEKNPPRGCRKRSWTRWGRSWWSSRCRRWDCGNLPPYCLARSPDQPWGETSKSGGWAKTWKWKWSRKISKKVDNSQQGRDFVEAVVPDGISIPSPTTRSVLLWDWAESESEQQKKVKSKLH